MRRESIPFRMTVDDGYDRIEIGVDEDDVGDLAGRDFAAVGDAGGKRRLSSFTSLAFLRRTSLAHSR